eukprot:Skav220903  [mRNA]  locus=scaffold3880:247598:257332:+ [translate_table: standard]
MKSAMWRATALALLVSQVQAVLVETQQRRKGRLECPPGPEPCTCNCAAAANAERRAALSNLMQALPGGPPPPATYPQLPAQPPPPLGLGDVARRARARATGAPWCPFGEVQKETQEEKAAAKEEKKEKKEKKDKSDKTEKKRKRKKKKTCQKLKGNPLLRLLSGPQQTEEKKCELNNFVLQKRPASVNEAAESAKRTKAPDGTSGQTADKLFGKDSLEDLK